MSSTVQTEQAENRIGFGAGPLTKGGSRLQCERTSVGQWYVPTGVRFCTLEHRDKGVRGLFASNMEGIFMEKTKEQIAMRVSTNTIIGNVLLSVLKLLAGIFGKSAAMLSDAVHSLSDVMSTLIVMIGVKLANKKADREHPYGHERFECVAAIILAAILCATGIGIGYKGVQNIVAGNYGDLAVPGIIALAAAILSIAAKEGMYWYTRAAAKKIDSSALMADAWHHRSDAFSSIGSFIGILGARVGYPVLDSVACLVICFFIVKAAYDIFMDAIGK